MHKSFLLQYGDCIERISCMPPFTRQLDSFSLHWFPNLKVFELDDLCCAMVARGKDKGLVNGKLDESRVLEVFKHWHRSSEDEDCVMTANLMSWIDSRRDVDRSFDVHVHVELMIWEPYHRFVSPTSRYNRRVST